MGTILASAIISKASTLLNDTSNTRWPTSEMLSWLNDGQRATVFIKPDSYSTHANLAMAAGTKQTLSSSYWMILNATRNMGSAGATPGKTITQLPRKVMDDLYPDWHTATANDVVDVVMYDPDIVGVYWVYPQQPSPSTHQIEALVARIPADVGAIGSAIIIDDKYQTALLDYMLFRAYAKEIETDYGAQRAEQQFQRFVMDVKMVDGGELKSAQRRNTQEALAAAVASMKQGEAE